MINLNDEEFNSSDIGPIFNGGTAGIAENVKISVEKRKPEDKDKAPDYKLIFTDENGGNANLSLWYVDGGTSFATEEELVKKQGKILKHLAHAILGKDHTFPNFENAKQMLDGVMKSLREGLKSGLKFRVFANYGSTRSVKKYIQIRTWVPFLEPMSVELEQTRLTKGNIDAMEPVKGDSFDASTVDTGAEAADDDDW